MLNENDVVKAVKRFLIEDEFEIQSYCTTRDRGIDIVAFNPRTSRELLIEAKGAASGRDGHEFTTAQIRSHVARAFFASAKALQDPDHPNAEAAMALPRLPTHMRLVESIEVALARLGISVFWVAEDGTVERFVPKTD